MRPGYRSGIGVVRIDDHEVGLPNDHSARDLQNSRLPVDQPLIAGRPCRHPRSGLPSQRQLVRFDVHRERLGDVHGHLPIGLQDVEIAEMNQQFHAGERQTVAEIHCCVAGDTTSARSRW